jgi:hypothetical protein
MNPTAKESVFRISLTIGACCAGAAAHNVARRTATFGREVIVGPESNAQL